MYFQCNFGGEECNLTDFQIVSTPMGFCLQFNGQGEPKRTYIYGEVYGLSVILNTMQDEYLYGKSRGAGFRVLVHERKEYPLVDSSGVRSSPGQVTSLGINQIRVKIS